MISPKSSDSFSDSLNRPEAIQSHGLLLVLHTQTLEIEQVSSNSTELLGITPTDLISKNATVFISPHHQSKFLKLVHQAAQSDVNPFELDVVSSDGSLLRCQGIAHAGEDHVTLLELEPLSSKTSVPDRFDRYIQPIQKSLQRSLELSDVGEIAKLMVSQMKEFTGFDRVMIYRFASEGSGEVIAEELEEGMEPHLHRRSPPSDNSPEARMLYRKNGLRVLHDTEGEASPIHPRNHPRLGGLPSLDQSVLRSMSSSHLQDLRGMGVRSLLSVSLIAGDKLWGLIVCHHRSPHFVPYGIRATSSLYGAVMSAQLARADQATANLELATRQETLAEILRGFDPLRSISSTFAKCLPSLLEVFEADGAALVGGEDLVPCGICPPRNELKVIAESLSKLSLKGVITTESIDDDFPSLANHFSQTAGMIAISLGHDHWLMILRDKDTATLAPEIKSRSIPWADQTKLLVDEFRSGLAGFFISRNRLLETANEELRHFSSVIAHELKSQIQPPLMALSLVREQSLGEKMNAMIDLGTNSLLTLSQFTSEMINFARMEVDQSELTDVDLSEIARNVTEQTVETLGATNVEVKVGELPLRRTSPSQSHHLLLNLVRNAIIHGPRAQQDDFKIEIGHLNTEAGPVFFVRDNGRGVAEDEQDQIFNYFFTGRSSKSGGGSGIGLSFIRKLLGRNGDRIWLESTEGEGTTFFFTIGKATNQSLEHRASVDA